MKSGWKVSQYFTQPGQQLVIRGSVPPDWTLHDGQVGREISVKHAVETQPPEGRRQFPLHIGPDGQAEHLSQPRPDTGGRLYHHMLLGVTQGVPHQARVVLLIEGTGGAGDDALSAVDARGLA